MYFMGFAYFAQMSHRWISDQMTCMRRRKGHFNVITEKKRMSVLCLAFLMIYL